MNAEMVEEPIRTIAYFNGFAQATPLQDGSRSAEEHGYNREYDLFYYMGHDPLNGVDGILAQLMKETGAVEISVQTGGSEYDEAPEGTTAVIRTYYNTIHCIDRYYGIDP